MEDLKQIMPKKLGFGCMRLPVANGNSEEIDDAVFCRMIDRYMEQGFVYFDTAYPVSYTHLTLPTTSRV